MLLFSMLFQVSCLLICSWIGAAFGANQFASGPFVVRYDPSDPPTIEIRLGGRLVWYTTTSGGGGGFLEAARINQSVSQNGGDYIFKFETLQTCSDAVILEASSSDAKDQGYPVIHFKGNFCGKVNFELQFQAVTVERGTTNTTHLLFNVSLPDSTVYNQLKLTYGCEKDEQFFGFGAQYTILNMKGRRLPLFLSEQGVGRGAWPLTEILNVFSPGAGGTWYTTYTRVPHYISSHSRSLLLESLEYAVFDMTQDTSVSIELNSHSLYGRIIPGSSPLDVITSYTAYVGRLEPLPPWVGRGAVLGLQGGTAAVQSVLKQVEQVWGNLSDVTAVWLQDWTGQRNVTGTKDLPRTALWWNWEVDSAHYPNWSELIANLNSKGIKTLTYINPLLSSNIEDRGTPFQHNFYKEALANNYLVKNSDGTIWTGYSNSPLVDISNPEAYKWMVNMIVNNMLSAGVCGWMCDFGESLPLTADLGSGQDPRQFHSIYPSLWGQLNADAISNASRLLGLDAASQLCEASDVVYFMRSGNVHSPSSSRLFWLGDQTVTWDSHDGLGTAIIGMLSEGLSGFSLAHSDTGGYTSILKWIVFRYLRSKELLMRWVELSAFTVMFRTHLGTLPEDNWQFNSDNETLIHFFNMTIVFQSWDFYRRELMAEASQYGWPVVRHMMLVFPNSSKVYTEDLRYQFLLGTELLVAPVYKKGGRSVKVFLPANTTWTHLWTNKAYKGNDSFVDIDAPMGSPCVLYPVGSKVGAQFVANLSQRKLLPLPSHHNMNEPV